MPWAAVSLASPWRTLPGDGKADIVTTNFSDNTVSVLVNQGSNHAAKVDYAVGGHAEGVAVADITGDGKADIVTANGNPTVSVLVNQGASTICREDRRPCPWA